MNEYIYKNKWIKIFLKLLPIYKLLVCVYYITQYLIPLNYLLRSCYENDISYTNARWTSIRFKELIAIYSCRGDLRGLLKSNINAAVVESI